MTAILSLEFYIDIKNIFFASPCSYMSHALCWSWICSSVINQYSSIWGFILHILPHPFPSCILSFKLFIVTYSEATYKKEKEVIKWNTNYLGLVHDEQLHTSTSYIFYFVSNCSLREISLDIQPQSSNRHYLLWQQYVVIESPS